MTRHLQRIINQQAENLLFLCGAGISYSPPASLPTVNKFVFEALRECGADADTVTAVEQKLSTGEVVGRFEVLVDELRKLRDSHLRIGQIFDSGGYNKIHYFLGRALLQGASVLTTNFDNCIENSLLDHAVSRIVFKGKDLISLPPVSGALVKIHGSNALRGQRSQLIITIKALSTTAQGFAKFPNWRSYLLRLLRDRTIIVMGYSGSDEFDINPVLLESRPRQILWIDFKQTGEWPIKSRRINNPRVRALAANLPLSYYRGQLEQLVKAWAESLSVRLRQSKLGSKWWDIREYIAHVYPALSHKEELINQILLCYALYELVARRKTRTVSPGITIQRIKALYRLGRTQESSRLYEKHQKQFRRMSDRSQALYFQSASLYQLGRLSEAVAVAEQQLLLTRAGNDGVAIIHALNNMGGIYFAVGTLAKAKGCYEQSLREQGEGISIEGQATAFWGLGNIASVNGRHLEAYELYLRARQTYIELGQDYSLNWTNLNVGLSLIELSRYSTAETFLIAAEQGFRAPLNRTGLLAVINGLGKLYYRRKWPRRAFSVLSEGMAIVEQIPQLPDAAEVALLFLGLLLREGADPREVHEKYRPVFEQVAAQRTDRNSKLLRRFLRSPKSASQQKILEELTTR
jgi:tetratricopeptide (TPR) repeat protein